MTVRGVVWRSLALVAALYLVFVVYQVLTPAHTAKPMPYEMGPPAWCATVTSPTPECYGSP